MLKKVTDSYCIQNEFKPIDGYIYVCDIRLPCLVNLTDPAEPKFISFDHELMPAWLRYFKHPKQAKSFIKKKVLVKDNVYKTLGIFYLYSSHYFIGTTTGPVDLPEKFVYYDHADENFFLDKSTDDAIYTYKLDPEGGVIYDNIPFKFKCTSESKFVNNVYILKYSN